MRRCALAANGRQAIINRRIGSLLNIVNILSRFNLLICFYGHTFHKKYLFRSQRVSYSVGNLVQFLPSGFVRVMWAKFQTEPVAHVTGKDVQVNVKHLLPRSLAVREEEIYPFAL